MSSARSSTAVAVVEAAAVDHAGLAAILDEIARINGDPRCAKAARALRGDRAPGGHPSIDDGPALAEMASLMAAGRARSATSAAKFVARALTGQSVEATIKRLVKKYRKQTS